MIKILFESHATTWDNEAKIASGAHDVELSDLGKKQALELGERYRHTVFDAVFCSALSRSYKTAEIAFSDRNFLIVQDARLNECNYGEYNGHPATQVESMKKACISVAFPGGESYVDTCKRVGEFLEALAESFQEKQVLIIGHRATQYALEHFLNEKTIEEAVTSAWTWQPGWEYAL